MPTCTSKASPLRALNSAWSAGAAKLTGSRQLEGWFHRAMQTPKTSQRRKSAVHNSKSDGAVCVRVLTRFIFE